MRAKAVLGEGIPLEGQVCSEIDFSEKCPRRWLSSLGFTKDEREKNSNLLGKYRS